MTSTGTLWDRFRKLPKIVQAALWVLLTPLPLLVWGLSGRSYLKGFAVTLSALWLLGVISASGSTPSSEDAGGSGDTESQTSTPVSKPPSDVSNSLAPSSPETSNPPSSAPSSSRPDPTVPPTTRVPEAVSALTSQLLVAREEPMAGYSRDSFNHWIDTDRNRCNTRCEVLAQEALPGGGWLSVYDGLMIYDASELDIDHMVPLAEAWRSGAATWTDQRREDFANDLTNPSTLIAVTASSNRSKGDRDPTGWRPQPSEWCSYAKAWISVKVQWSLRADPAEIQSLERMLRVCPST